MVSRYARAFNIQNAKYYPFLFNELHTRREITHSVPEYVTIIDCVDNVKARRQIHDFIYKDLMELKRLYNRIFKTSWISAGNGLRDGQVAFTHFYEEYNELRERLNQGKRYDITTLFPQQFSDDAIKEEEDRLSRISCADNAISSPQTMNANVTAANIALNIFSSLFLFDNIR
jgi:hypothetical protein